MEIKYKNPIASLKNVEPDGTFTFIFMASYDGAVINLMKIFLRLPDNTKKIKDDL